MEQVRASVSSESQLTEQETDGKMVMIGPGLYWSRFAGSCRAGEGV